MRRAKLGSQLYRAIKKVTVKERVVYDTRVLQMYHDYEELVFNLAEQSKNETIESIKNMTVGQRMKFTQLIKRRKRPKNG